MKFMNLMIDIDIDIHFVHRFIKDFFFVQPACSKNT